MTEIPEHLLKRSQQKRTQSTPPPSDPFTPPSSSGSSIPDDLIKQAEQKRAQSVPSPDEPPVPSPTKASRPKKNKKWKTIKIEDLQSLTDEIEGGYTFTPAGPNRGIRNTSKANAPRA